MNALTRAATAALILIASGCLLRSSHASSTDQSGAAAPLPFTTVPTPLPDLSGDGCDVNAPEQSAAYLQGYREALGGLYSLDGIQTAQPPVKIAANACMGPDQGALPQASRRCCVLGFTQGQNERNDELSKVPSNQLTADEKECSSEVMRGYTAAKASCPKAGSASFCPAPLAKPRYQGCLMSGIAMAQLECPLPKLRMLPLAAQCNLPAPKTGVDPAAAAPDLPTAGSAQTIQGQP